MAEATLTKDQELQIRLTNIAIRPETHDDQAPRSVVTFEIFANVPTDTTAPAVVFGTINLERPIDPVEDDIYGCRSQIDDLGGTPVRQLDNIVRH